MADTSGPAFPTSFSNWDAGLGGMSLRAWFAGQALPSTVLDVPIRSPRSPEAYAASVAKLAVQIADAMLTELQKEPSHGQS